MNQNLTEKVTKEVSCEEAGEKKIVCADCGEIIRTEKITALGHLSAVIPGKAATCTEQGLTDGEKCSRCGKVLVQQEAILALGHKWDKGSVTTQPTCEQKGVKTFTCQNDSSHKKTEDIPAQGHKWDNGSVTTQPSCEQKGVKTFSCQRAE